MAKGNRVLGEKEAANRRFDLDNELRVWLSQAIKQSALSREEVAERVSELLNRHITVAQINSWSAGSKSHKLPAAYLAAFLTVLGEHSILEDMASLCGLYVVSRDDWLRLRLAKVREEKARLELKEQALEALLSGEVL